MAARGRRLRAAEAARRGGPVRPGARRLPVRHVCALGKGMSRWCHLHLWHRPQPPRVNPRLLDSAPPPGVRPTMSWQHPKKGAHGAWLPCCLKLKRRKAWRLAGAPYGGFGGGWEAAVPYQLQPSMAHVALNSCSLLCLATSSLHRCIFLTAHDGVCPSVASFTHAGPRRKESGQH